MARNDSFRVRKVHDFKNGKIHRNFYSIFWCGFGSDFERFYCEFDFLTSTDVNPFFRSMIFISYLLTSTLFYLLFVFCKNAETFQNTKKYTINHL